MNDTVLLLILVVDDSSDARDEPACSTRVGAGSKSYDAGWDRIFAQRQQSSQYAVN